MCSVLVKGQSIRAGFLINKRPGNKCRGCNFSSTEEKPSPSNNLPQLAVIDLKLYELFWLLSHWSFQFHAAGDIK
jgi:hypothetical protein